MSDEIKRPTEAEIVADRVRSIVTTEAYEKSIGAWLLQGKESAILDMARENDLTKNAVARGRFQAFNEIFEQIELCLARGDAMASKRMAKMIKNNKEQTDE